ncbi:MAG: muropeptide transporter [Burkholderiales bacterium]|nr:muropeptide transporter [Burkholderiales bacterium]
MSWRDLTQVFASRRIGILLLLGFSSGLPLALTTGTLQAWATVEGVDVKTIGFLTLVGSAYTLKFLWAPFMDRYVPPLLGRRRGWMLVTQFALIASIAAMGSLSPRDAVVALALMAVLVAFFSASQDVAFDAYRTDVLATRERGAGAAVSVLGYRLAMLVSGGLALVIADSFLGWRATYWLMAGLMLIGVVATWFAPEPEVAPVPPRSLDEAVIAPLKDFFSRSGALFVLVLIVLYKLGDAFAGSLTTTFLIRGVGFTATEVGAINKILGLTATIVGALAGGALMTRLSLYRSLMLFGILQALTNFGFWVLAVTPKATLSMATVVALENLCGGMGTAAFVAFLMALTRVRYSATQFALLSALAAVGRTYIAGPSSGVLVAQYGWASFFLFTVAAALPGLALLRWRRADIEALDAEGQAGGLAPPAAASQTETR